LEVSGQGHLQLRLLGGFQIIVPQLAEIDIRGQKSCGLLAIVALAQGASVSRDRLAGLLWSNSENDAARNSLRQTVTLLKRGLGSIGDKVLDCSRGMIGLCSDLVWTDVAEFEASVRAGRLDHAVDLYSGPFLNGIYVRDPAFEDWSATERRRLARMHADALESLVQAESGSRRVHFARKLVEADPLRESAHHLLIEALDQIGERDEALRQIRAVEEILRAELGIGLSPETLALKQALQKTPPRSFLRPDQGVVVPSSPLLAVHPFATMPETDDQLFFAKSLMTGLLTTLSKLPYLRVLSFSPAGKNQKRDDNLAALDRVNAPDFILDGSLVAVGDRRRLAVQLVDSRSGEITFARRYEINHADALASQDEITLSISVAINVALLQGDQALTKLGTSNLLEPWELILQASTLISSHDRVCSPAARRFIEEAIRLDPGYSAAHTLLGWWHWGQAFCGWSQDPAASVADALAAASKGSQLDPENPEPYAVMAITHMQARNFSAAEQALTEAFRRGQNHAMVYAVAANVAMFAGRPEQAIRLTQHAIRLCPVYPPWYAGDMAQAHLQLGQLRKALEWCDAAISRSTGYLHAHCFRIIALQEIGQTDDAAAAVGTLLRIDPAFVVSAWTAAQPFLDPAINQRFRAALLGAGLPDNTSRFTPPGKDGQP